MTPLHDAVAADMNRDQKKQLASANAEAIRIGIKKLEESIGNEQNVSFADFWIGARDVTDMFKTFKPLEQKTREELWSAFQELCESVRTAQEGAMGQLRRASSEFAARIEELVKKAAALIEEDTQENAVNEADSLLKEALALMKSPKKKSEEGDGEDEPDGEQTVLLKKDRDRCWPQWVEVREKIQDIRRANQEETLKDLRAEAEQLAADSNEKNPKDVKEQIKVVQEKLKQASLRPSDREKLRRILKKAWETASKRFSLEIEERQQKHREWVERMTEHLKRWETNLLKSRYLLEQADDLSSGKGHRSEKFLKEIEDLEDKINSVRNKLGKEAPEPVTELSPEEKEHLKKSSRRQSTKKRSPRHEKVAIPKPPPTGLNLGEILAEQLKGTGLLADDDTKPAKRNK